MFKNFRQLLYPKEFRIKSSGVSIEKLHLENILGNIEKEINEEIKKLDSLSVSTEKTTEIDRSFIKEIATSIWSLEKRIRDKSIEGAEIVLDKISSFLSKHGIEIRDYTGSKYDPNESWDKVLGETKTIKDNEVLTIKNMGKPRVIYSGIVIQKGIPIL